MKIYQKSILALITALAWMAAGPGMADDGVAFEDAWIRAMPPGMKMTAGFGTLSNTGPDPLELVAFASPSFGDVSLHRSELVEGVSRMYEVESLVLAPGQAMELAPGGYHLMLMMPTGTFAPGDEIRVEMSSSDGRSFSFLLPVLGC